MRLSDVVKAFPLSSFNDGHEYVLRFLHEINLSQGRKRKVWLDINKGDDVSVPSVDDRIKIKALRLPKGIASKKTAPSQQVHRSVPGASAVPTHQPRVEQQQFKAPPQ